MSSKEIERALEHYEIATTHLGIALHLLTDGAKVTPGLDEEVFTLGIWCAEFLACTQPVLKYLCDAGVYKMPHEALALLANSDPEAFLEVSQRVRKELRKSAD